MNIKVVETDRIKYRNLGCQNIQHSVTGKVMIARFIHSRGTIDYITVCEICHGLGAVEKIRQIHGIK